MSTHTTPPVSLVDAAGIGRWHRSTRRVTWPLRRLWLDLTIEGLGNLPADGPVIVAANHLSFLDSVLLMFETPRRVTFLGKAEYLQSPILRHWFPAAGMIPVDRSGRGVAWSLAQARQHLMRGEAIGIFPEGTRSRDGLLHRGHPGVAHLAIRSGAPIVPVGIVGTDRAQPRHARVPRPGSPITLRFGPPVDLGRWRGRRPVATTKREITDEVMAAIAVQSGQRRSEPAQPKKRSQMISLAEIS